MAITKTIEFLPAVFQSDTNRKFLNATLDQLVNEPKLNRVNGYIGRKFSPTYKSTDRYVLENNALRTNYQLEPSVVVKDKTTGNVDFYTTYPELLQKINYYAGTTTNQNALWESEYYTYNPHIDLDKFINFSQYYWLPNGPDAVDVQAGAIDLEHTYQITSASAGTVYNVSGYYDSPNPDIVLARNGVYKFVINQPGKPFWIQSAPGTAGKVTVLSNASSRDVLGVENNGTDNGVITFRVPSKTAQDFYINMPKVQDVDLATSLSYYQIQNRLLSAFLEEHGGIDGPQTQNGLDNKYIIFAQPRYDDADWVAGGLFDGTGTEFDSQSYDQGAVVPTTQRYGIWQIKLVPVGALPNITDYIVTLQFVQTIPLNHKVYVKAGLENGGTEWFYGTENYLQRMPLITADLDTLYYQDGETSSQVGVIRLVDSNNNTIDVEKEILGKLKYVSPNGVVLTNGMKIKFDSSVVPTTYANNEYYIEGVGTGIKLTLVSDLSADIGNEDYMVINRASRERSPWTRGNRWFHKEVIRASAYYNNTAFLFDQEAQARRPIIEFEPDLQLFNFGSNAKSPVDVYDDKITQPFTTVEGKPGFYIDGVELKPGMRIIFAADQDPETRNNIWVVTFIDIVGFLPSDPKQIHLVLADDGEVTDGDTVLVKSGINHGNKNYWFSDNTWQLGQIKSEVNQAPLFDVYDYDGVSFGDRSKYPISNIIKFFSGTKVFSYATGAGANDPVLGIPLAYKNFSNIGDIKFTNNFDSEVFQYVIDQVNYTKKVNTGLLKKTSSSGDEFLPIWNKVNQPSTQYQHINYNYDGVSNYFFVDVLPTTSANTTNLMVYANSKLLNKYQYVIENLPARGGFNVFVSRDVIGPGSVIDILINSDSVSKLGYYQVPVNLDLNAQNSAFIELTLGDLRNHMAVVARSATAFAGDFPGSNNLRDIDASSHAGTILQHTAGIPYASMFLTDEKTNLVDAVTYSAQEYTRFKNKFLEIAATNANIAYQSPQIAVDQILAQINLVKNKSFPWFYSDMVPYGDEKHTITYNIFNPAVKNYEMTSIFDDTVTSNRAVLVYINGVQLTKGRDYIIPENIAAVTISDSYALNVNDVLEIVEYSNTNGCYIPETPSKLGLYPKFTPAIYTDNTYRTPVTMIRGHDGSLTPAFGDFRDELLLELECRIYNNIKVNYDEAHFGVHNAKPGKFRNTGYDLTAFNNVLNRTFLNWVGLNRLDYSTNVTWDVNDQFTWNYRTINDLEGERLPGSWRACFDYYYDTQRPHTAPWEMLGFSERPDWWVATYGPAPYTGGNLVMWRHLEQGYIAQGPRKGVDSRFARPGLLNYIPVDASGNLRPPAGLMCSQFLDTSTNSAWAPGTQSPVETAWRNSSEYPYAMQIAMAVTKPARYFGVYLNTHLNKFVELIGQYQNIETKQRLNQIDVVINGTDDESGNTLYAAGYINWIADYLRNMGINPQLTLGHYIKDFDIQLSYRLAGYSDKTNLKVLAEQNSPNSVNDSIIIPDSDYDLILNKSVPTRRLTYSAVIIERTSQGYKVSGYDTTNPVFSVIPPDPGGETYEVKVLNQGVTIYKKYRTFRVSFPYGYEFTTIQQVANFLTGYGLSLTVQGFRFDEYDQTLEEIRNWVLSVKEFLFWAQQGWSAGNVLVLSPVADKIRVTLADAVVDEVTNTVYGSKVVNQNFQTLKTNAYNIIRDGNIFECATINQDTISYAEFNAVQYEHALIFNNVTMFNDTIYVPSIGARQYRLKLIGFKTAEWTGNFNPQGFIFNKSSVDAWQPGKDYLKGDLVDYKGLYYTAKTNLSGANDFSFADWIKIDQSRFKTGLLNNFATNSQISDQFYNVDGVNLESQFDLFGKGLIGYKNRSYLNSLDLDDTSQVKFYQGFIREKGTQNALNALSQLKFNNISSDVEFFEEWAFRVGEYGALDINQFVEVNLLDSDVLGDPFSVEFITDTSDGTADIEVATPYKSSQLVFQPQVFLNRPTTATYINDIATAGFVNLEDIDVTVFDISNTKELTARINSLGAGTRIWCAKDFASDWNVFRVSETKVSVTSVTNILDGFVEMQTNVPHSLVSGDIVMIKSIDQFTGVYFVNRVTATNKFVVSATDSGVELSTFGSLTDVKAPIYTLVSMRFKYTSEIDSIRLPDGWKSSEFAWVDNSATDKWGVYKKTTPWAYQRLLGVGEDVAQANLGAAVSLSLDANFALVGKPNENLGVVANYAKSYANRLTEKSAVAPNTLGTIGFGQTIDQGDRWAVVGAPLSDNNRGHVFTLRRDNYGDVIIKQCLGFPDSVQGSLIGTSVTISRDDQWIYVGSPGTDSVYVFGFVPNTISEVDEITTDGFLSRYTLKFIPDSVDSIRIQGANREYVPYVDFTIDDGATVVFTETPAAGVIAVTQEPGFRYVGKIQGPVGSNFGFSVACATDGAQVIIGAPLADVDDKAKAGLAYVYDRTVEAFFADGETRAFATLRPLVPTTKVYVDGDLQGRENTADENPSYVINTLGQVQFFTAPYPGSTVTIETNEFNLIEVQTPEVPSAEAQFGYSVELCPTNCSLYVGAPYFNDGNRNAGAVFRFFNQGRTYGTILGTVQNPVVTSGSSIRIENFEIQFIETRLDDVVSAINRKAIPGITAFNENGYLRINSQVTIRRNKLPITPGFGNAISELGLDIYPQIQVITNPYSREDEFFGKRAKITRQLPYDNTLVVSSEVGTTYKITTYDGGATTLDNKSTNMLDAAYNTGAVYVFEYLGDSRDTIEHPGKFTFIQQLVPNSPVLTSGDKYGYDFDIMGSSILVGAPTESSVFENSGQVFVFENPNNVAGWQLLRQSGNKVNIDAVNRFYLYNKKSNTIINSLDYVDPAKGKILGIAEQEIKYKTAYDPASYNQGNNATASFSTTNHWSDKQVGEVWWDLGTIRYVDYEQGSTSYRTTNWGKIFPGSSVDVYEWVESNYLPSQYVSNGGNGIPMYADDSAYVVLDTVDSATGETYNTYYYWVKNKTTVDANQFGRSIPVSNVRDIIENPKGQGIEFAAAIKDNAVALFNVGGSITSEDVVLHVDYDSQLNSSLIHSEWELVSEGVSGLGSFPDSIYNKMIDSLSGADEFGNIVPDPFLAVQNRYGTQIRPRQTMFIERETALKTLIDSVNQWLKSIPLTQVLDVSALTAQESIPPINSGAWNIRVPDHETLTYIDINTRPTGFKVLVDSDATVSGLWTIYTKTENNTWFLSRVQAYDSSAYWEYQDWYAEGFDASVVPTYTVDTPADIAKLTLVAEDIVKIRNDGSGNFKIIQVFQTVTNTIGLGNGTIKFKSSLYDLAGAGMGFDNDNFGVSRFDQNASIETRVILKALAETIMVDDYATEFSKSLMLLVNYILTEQKYTDWLFKTSFVNVLHKIRKLNQPAIYIRDNQDYYLEYINEVKPYHTTIREYVMDYEGVDNVNGYVTDFDLPAYYDQRLQLYRSPSGEYVQDVTALQRAEYLDWVRSYTYSIPTGLNSISLARPGFGYLTKPVVTITGSVTGDNAEAEAVIDYSNQKITAINVTKAGTGYIGRDSTGLALPPTVTITGGSLPRDVKLFQPGLEVSDGDYVFDSYALRYYLVTSSGTLGNYRPTHVDGETKNGTADLRYYGEQATAYVNLENTTIRKVKTTLTFDRMTYSSTVKEWTANTVYAQGDIIVYNNIAYQATDAFTSGASFSGVNLQPYTFVTGPSTSWNADTAYEKNALIEYNGVIYIATADFTSSAEFDTNNLEYYTSTTANDRVRAYYQPGAGLPGDDFSLIESGITYPGVQITGPLFEDDPKFDSGGFDMMSFDNFEIGPDGTIELGKTFLDTIIQSEYTDEELGQRPEDINIDGGAYVDTYSSHAPEELIPGRVFDTLDLQVYQTASTNPTDEPISWRQFKTMTGQTEFLRVAVNSTTNLAADLSISDTVIHVDNAAQLPDPSPELAIPGVVFVNGERITYYTIDRETNTLSQLRRGTAGTGTPQVHVAGTRVVDGSRGQVIPYGTDKYGVALFQSAAAGNGVNTTFETTLTGETALSLTQDQVSSLEELIAFIENPLITSTSDLVPVLFTVYVGGTELRYDLDMSNPGALREYSASLVEDVIDGNTVYRISVSTNNPPPQGVWVAIELKTSDVWFNIDGYSGSDPTSSSLANSSTAQAIFLKTEAGILP